MAVREFNGTSEYVRLSIGGLATATYGTFAALYKVDDTANLRVMFCILNSGNSFLWAPIMIDGADLLTWGGASDVEGPTSPQAIWALVVVRKASGTATPRFSVYNYNTTSWTHQNANAAVANGTAPTSGFINVNVDGGGSGGEAYDGRLAVTAAWLNTVKWAADSTGDAQIEAAGLHTNYANWVTAAPTGLWRWDGLVAAGVTDAMGGGANQVAITGTTRVTGDDPPGFTFPAATNVERVAVTTGAPGAATAFSPTLPTHATGDRMILAVVGKIETTTIPTINQSWVLLKSGTGGTGTNAADTGQTFWAVYGKDATSGSETAPTVTPGGTAPNSWEWIAATHRPAAGKVWADAIGTSAAWVQSASDTTTATPLTGTAGAWTGVQPTTDDAIFAVGVIPTDLGTALGATTLTATGLSGGTKDTATSQYVENALNNDSAAVWAGWTSIVGTASAGLAMSFTVTGATNQSGSLIAIALRQGAGTTSVSSSIATSWHARQAITPTVAESWKVRQEITKTVAQSWPVEITATQNVAQSWRVRQAITPTVAETWNLQGRINQTVAESWRVRDDITQTVAQSWRVRQAINQTVAESWRVRSTVTANNANAWKLAERVTSSTAQAWLIRSVVSESTAQAWAAKTTATQTVAESWRVRAAITATYAAVWNVAGAALPTVTSSLTTAWHTRAVITANTAQTWAVKITATQTVAESWRVRQAIVKTTAETWNLRAAITSNTAQQWAVKTLLTQTVAESWRVRQATTQSSAQLWNVAGLLITVTNSLATSWHAVGRITTSSAQTWAVRAALAQSVAESWRVRQAIAKTTAETWHIRTTITPAITQTWAVRATATQTAATSWRLRQAVTAAAVQAWNVYATGSVSTSQALSWRVRTTVTSAAAETWAVRTSLTSNTAQIWAVRITATRTVTETWNVLALLAVTSSQATSWRVRAWVSPTITETWHVRSRTTESLSEAWKVRRVATATNLSSWAVKGHPTALLVTLWRVDGRITTIHPTSWKVQPATFYPGGPWDNTHTGNGWTTTPGPRPTTIPAGQGWAATMQPSTASSNTTPAWSATIEG